MDAPASTQRPQRTPFGGGMQAGEAAHSFWHCNKDRRAKVLFIGKEPQDSLGKWLIVDAR